MTSLSQLLSASKPEMGQIQEFLDSLEPSSRLREVRSLKRTQQKRLYETSKGFYPLDLSFLVPLHCTPLQEVVHEGKNSLPAFSNFAKVFCRPDGPEAESECLWGYNRTGSFLSTAVGPGYFIARPHEEPGELLVDYLMTPPRKPQAWPPILPNKARLSRLVYYQTQDILRGVSKHVSIGLATKKGKSLNAWFILCRQDAPDTGN